MRDTLSSVTSRTLQSPRRSANANRRFEFRKAVSFSSLCAPRCFPSPCPSAIRSFARWNRWLTPSQTPTGPAKSVNDDFPGGDREIERDRVKSKHLPLAIVACYAGEMARPLRVEFEDAIYHLCAPGNARQDGSSSITKWPLLALLPNS